jgi:hypothetical protein
MATNSTESLNVLSRSTVTSLVNMGLLPIGLKIYITIIQKWDGNRPSIQPLLRHFRIWLIQKRINDIEELKKQEKKHVKFQMTVSHSQESANAIKWIEKGILEHPLPDHRKAAMAF